MPDIVFCQFQKIAITLAKMSAPDFADQLLDTIPLKMFNTTLTDKNIDRIMSEINHICLGKQDKLAGTLGLGKDWENDPKKKKRIEEVLSRPTGKLPASFEPIRREIKFLKDLNASIGLIKSKRQPTQ